MTRALPLEDRRELVRAQIDAITVKRAPWRSTPETIGDRLEIEWAEPEDVSDEELRELMERVRAR